MHLRFALIAVSLATSVAFAQVERQGAGQQPPLPKLPGTRAVVGIILDTLGTPVEDVDVRISPIDRHARTARDGTFRFNDVKPGTYQVSTRKVGYLPMLQRVAVSDSGGAVAIALIPYMRMLPAAVTSASRGGISGVVGDTAYRAVPGAEVHALASGEYAKTDSMGAFFLDVHPGRYMVRVTRPGFAAQMVSVTVPNDSGRKVMFWLRPARRGEGGREMANAQNLAQRLALRSAGSSRIFTREDIARIDPHRTVDLAQAAAVRYQDDYCEAILDGGPFRVPLWTIDPEDIELMEVYAGGPARRPPTSISRGGRRIATGTTPMGSSSGCAVTYVWMRR